MRDLFRSLRDSGGPVPVPWPSLSRLIKPRAKNLMVVCAAPGVGKSVFALDWAFSLDEPSLYISLDTSLVDHAVRVASRETGVRIEDVIKGYDEDVNEWLETWGTVISELDYPVRFFDHQISARHVGEVIAAEAEYWGEPPKMVIVDMVANLVEEESAQLYEKAFRDLYQAAKENNTFVLALHHPKKGKSDDDDPTEKPVRQSDVLYAGNRNVQFLLGLWRPREDRLQVAILKNRMGRSDPTGFLNVPLEFRGDMARVA